MEKSYTNKYYTQDNYSSKWQEYATVCYILNKQYYNVARETKEGSDKND